MGTVFRLSFGNCWNCNKRVIIVLVTISCIILWLQHIFQYYFTTSTSSVKEIIIFPNYFPLFFLETPMGGV